MKERSTLTRSILIILILIFFTLPSWAESYLVLSRPLDGLSGRTALEKSAFNKLIKAGIAPEKIKQTYPFLGAAMTDLEAGTAAKLRSERPDLVIIKADVKLYHSTEGTDLSEQSLSETPWHVLKAQPLQEYAIEMGADFSSVLIFVLDTGVDTDHPDLTDNLDMTYARHFYDTYLDGVASDDLVTDYQGHGSEVTGTIVGSTTGVTPSLKVVPIRSATNRGGLSITCLTAACDYIMGLKEGELTGTNIIINLSYNSDPSSTSDNELADFFDVLFANLKDHEILFVGSAGNNGIDTDVRYVYPTWNESNNYVAAASAGSNGVLSGFSNYGDLKVEVASPGSSILTTDRTGSYVTVDGTSFASPFTAGIAGLIWAIEPNLEYWEVRNLLINAIGGVNVTTSFLSDYRGSEDDYLLLPLSDLVSSTYEDEPVNVMAGKALSPSVIADMTYGPDPENGEEHVPFDAVLSWDSALDPVSYDLWFGTDDDTLVKISKDPAASSTGLPDIEEDLGYKLSYDTCYFWRVNLHSGETSTIGTTWRLKTVTLKAYDNSPVNNAVNVDSETVLSWNYDMEGSTFDVYLSADENSVSDMDIGALIVSGTSLSSLNVRNLGYNTTYYWRVVTHFSDPERDLVSSAIEGDILNFTTKAEDGDPDLVMSGGGGGGCSSISGLHTMVLMIAPLLILLKNKL